MVQTAERVTVNLTGKAARALASASKRTGMSKTDVVNRALQVYDYIDLTIESGDEVLIRSRETGEIQRLRMM